MYGALPNQSAYYTSEDTLVNFGSDPENFPRSLQIKQHPEKPYRHEVGVYEVLKDMRVPDSWFGSGDQIFIKDFNHSLKLLRKMPIRENLEFGQLKQYEFSI